MPTFDTFFRADKHGLPIEHGASLTLAGPRAATMWVATGGCLRVEKGAAWITVTPADEQTQADDVVLHTGECLKLAAGQEFVLESWVLAKSRRTSRYVSVRWESDASRSANLRRVADRAETAAQQGLGTLHGAMHRQCRPAGDSTIRHVAQR